jgi:hypothetical protein
MIEMTTIASINVNPALLIERWQSSDRAFMDIISPPSL